jgi:hypothetical protein
MTKTYGIFWIRHGIEWTQCHGEFVDDIIIRVMLRFDQPSKPLLVLRAEKKNYDNLTDGCKDHR